MLRPRLAFARIMQIWARSELKRRRAKMGFTATEFAQQMALTRQWWSEIENKRRPTSPHTARRACDALDATFDELFFIKDDGPQD